MAMDLIDTVRQQYEAHRSGVPPPQAMHYQSAAPQQQQLVLHGGAPPGAQGGFAYGGPGVPGVPGGMGAAPGYSVPGAAPGADPYAQYGGYQGYQQYCTFPSSYCFPRPLFHDIYFCVLCFVVFVYGVFLKELVGRGKTNL